jgi:recombination associated protein RdgC
VEKSPASAMTGWLAADEAPTNFSIDQDTELRASGESRAAIRYVKHSIDADDVRRHIGYGKHCTRLALTWADRVSFVLTESLDIRRIAPLDLMNENGDALGQTDDERFDADFVLMTGELAKLLSDLLLSLGGERKADQPPAPDLAGADPLFTEAKDLIVKSQRGSISLIQRHLRIGYNRAAQLLESLEQHGVISPMRPDGARTVLLSQAVHEATS